VGTAALVVRVLSFLLGVVALVAILRVFVSVGCALVEVRRQRSTEFRSPPVPTQPVSVLVAACNEEESIAGTLEALCASSLTDLEVIVIDDGSQDGTRAEARRVADPRIQVISRPHGGKARALAAGLALARHDVIVTVDADTRVQPGTLAALISPLVDRRVGGVAGHPAVSNRNGVLGAAQHLEYAIGNDLERRMLDLFGTQATIPGAIGAYRRAALDGVGGFTTATIAEDTDVTLALVEAGWTIRYAPRARAATDAPRRWADLWRQRSRWSFGIVQSAWRHRAAARDSDGSLSLRGSCALAYVFVVQTLVPCAAPFVDLAAIWGLVTLDRSVLVACAVFFVAQLISAAIALRLGHEPLRGLWVFPLQFLVYRQVTSLVAIQTIGWALAGRRTSWSSLSTTRGTTVAVRDAAGSERGASGEPVPSHATGSRFTESIIDLRAEAGSRAAEDVAVVSSA